MTQRRQSSLQAEIESLLAEAQRLVTVNSDRNARVVFPGSFNPLHIGHRRMAAFAERHIGCGVHFELSVENVDKPPLTWPQIQGRLRQFEGSDRVLVTRAPRFEDKVRLFPQATFLVGVDTLLRLANPKYARIEDGHLPSLESLCQSAQFLVYGRVLAGRFQGLRQLDLPECLRTACQEVPETEFRVDISSTLIRDSD